MIIATAAKTALTAATTEQLRVVYAAARADYCKARGWGHGKFDWLAGKIASENAGKAPRALIMTQWALERAAGRRQVKDILADVVRLDKVDAFCAEVFQAAGISAELPPKRFVEAFGSLR